MQDPITCNINISTVGLCEVIFVVKFIILYVYSDVTVGDHEPRDLSYSPLSRIFDIIH